VGWGLTKYPHSASNDRKWLSIPAIRYIQQCLAAHVVPFAQLIGQQFLLMQDNARFHVARSVTEYLEETNIQRLVWPARSPDLNPIEHVWDMLGRRVRNRQPNTLSDLRTALLEEWENIPPEAIRNCIESMPRRMVKVMRKRGGNIRY